MKELIFRDDNTPEDKLTWGINLDNDFLMKDRRYMDECLQDVKQHFIKKRKVMKRYCLKNFETPLDGKFWVIYVILYFRPYYVRMLKNLKLYKETKRR